MPYWNQNSATAFFPNTERGHLHRGIGGDWRMQIAFPPVNIARGEEKMRISIVAPGYTREDFTIKRIGNKLRINAEHREQHEEQTEGYIHREYEMHSFERDLILPEEVADHEIDATYESGILNIYFPRREPREQHESAVEIPVQ